MVDFGYKIYWCESGAIITYTPSFRPIDSQRALVNVGDIDVFANFKYIIHDFTAVKALNKVVAINIVVAPNSLTSFKDNRKLKTAVVTSDKVFIKELEEFHSLTSQKFQVFAHIELAVSWVNEE